MAYKPLNKKRLSQFASALVRDKINALEKTVSEISYIKSRDYCINCINNTRQFLNALLFYLPSSQAKAYERKINQLNAQYAGARK